jgi:molybdopterin-guanine dinucleotide biosynthesis protein A
MKLPMPAAVLAGGASRRMGAPKAELPYGAGTLLEHQVSRLGAVFERVFVVAKEPVRGLPASVTVVFDRSPDHAAVHGLARALEEVRDHVFVLAVDLPVLAMPVARAIAQAALTGGAAAVVPEADGRLQPLAAVWRRGALPEVERRISSQDLSVSDIARAVGASVFPEDAWRPFDPSGRSFMNVNTLEEYLAVRERG